jgi:hypothetical protein
MKKTEEIKTSHNPVTGTTFEVVNKADCATCVQIKKAKASAQPQSKANLLNKLYDKYNDCFANTMPSFHNLLWQLMINGVHKGKRMCFYAALTGGENTLGLVTFNEAGYYPAVFFKETVNFPEMEAIVNNLNQQVFDVDEKEYMRIVSSSMAAGSVLETVSKN